MLRGIRARRYAVWAGAAAFLLIVMMAGLGPWSWIPQVSAGTPSITRVVQADTFPNRVAVDGTRGYAWTSNYLGGGGQGSVSRINLNTYQVDTFSGSVRNPQGIAVNPATGKVYISNDFEDSSPLTIITDPNNPGAWKQIRLGKKGFGVAVDSVRNRAYVANMDSGSISVIDGATDGEITRVSVTGQPAFIAVDETANRVYVTSFNINDRSQQVVSLIEPDRGWSVTRTNQPLGEPYGIAVDPVSRWVFVASNTGGRGYLSAFNENFDKQWDKDLANQTLAVGINHLTRRWYVGSAGENKVIVLNRDLVVETTIDCGRACGLGIAVEPNSGKVLVVGPQTADHATNISDVLVIQDDVAAPTATSTPVNTPTPTPTSTPTPTPTPSIPMLQLNKAEVDFVVDKQETSTGVQHLYITNVGGGQLNWRRVFLAGSEQASQYFRFSKDSGSAAQNARDELQIYVIGPVTQTVDATMMILGDGLVEKSPQNVKLRIAVADPKRKLWEPFITNQLSNP